MPPVPAATPHRSFRGSVCVVGAGIAGLVTARVLQEDGFAVTVFDRAPEIGGVWASGRTYPGLRANNPRETYAFSDFPYPAAADEFPTAAQIREYLTAYVARFGLRPLLRLSTDVTSIGYRSGQGEGVRPFRVTVRPRGEAGATERLDFDFVAVCNGVFSKPSVPDIEGRAWFSGSVLHSSEFLDPAVVRGRRVVVIGAGKSALDCATAAAEHGASCTLVFRTPHWMVPRYFPGGVRVDRLFVTRLAEMLFPQYHRPTQLEARLHRTGAPVLRLWWRLQTRLVPLLCGMPAVMLPATPLPGGLESSGVGTEFYDALRRGGIRAVRAGVAAFAGADTIRLDTEAEVAADVVILATGWRQDLDFLDPELRGMVRPGRHFRLYRHILPPAEPRLGFIGYASSTACPLVSELAAHWLAHCFRGDLVLPRREDMDHEIDRVLEWLADVFPGRADGYFIGPYIAHYADELLGDLGILTRRAGSALSEYLAPVWSTRYAGVAEERRHLTVSAGGGGLPERLPA
jgi:dimethylaniline monooxygenase (N-oxide forming)